MQMNPQHSEGGGPVEGPNGDAERHAVQLADLAEGPELRDILRRRTQLLADRAGLVDRLEAASRGSLSPGNLRFPSQRTRSWGRVAAALVAAAIGVALFLWPQSQQQPPIDGAPPALAQAVDVGAGVLVETPSEPVLVSLLLDSDVVEVRSSALESVDDPIDLLRARDASYRKLVSEVQLIALAAQGVR
ncbi:MAG: hypothetical protein FJ285_02830 [Planctomycetes bacterium]|nr:hypothetical protein [Planctomycetota bacterium]